MMNVYRQKKTQPLKWLVALIIFILALGITFTDVYGYGGSGTASSGDQPGSQGERIGPDAPANGNSDSNAPSAVPEPSTLILLAGGLSALYIARRRKNSIK